MSVVSGVFTGNPLYLSEKAQESLRKQQTTFQKTGQEMQMQDLQAAKKSANSLLDTTTFSSLGKNQALTTAANALGSTLEAGSLTGAENAAHQISMDLSAGGKPKPHSDTAPPAILNAGTAPTMSDLRSTAARPSPQNSSGGSSGLDVYA